jgi:hypothetical protein
MGKRKHTIRAWRSKYGGMDVSEAKEVKQCASRREFLATACRYATSSTC